MPEYLRLANVARMRGNRYGTAKKGRSLPAETRAKVSAGLKRAYAEGRIIPRKPIYSPEERREHHRVRSRKRYALHKEQILQRQREWYKAHPDRKKEINNAYTARHRERLNAKQREKNKTPEHKAFMYSYAPKHRADKPELYRTYYQNRRARKLSALGSHTENQWLSRLVDFAHRCAYCGASRKMCRDHDIPLARGGSNDISNIVPACGSCNSAKGTLTADEFRNRLSGQGPSMDARWSAQLTTARTLRYA